MKLFSQILIHRRIMIALCILCIVVLAAIIGPWFSPYDYETGSATAFSPPSWQHWGGTDLLGRDVFTRMLYGARISLLVGFVGALVSLLIGVSYGAISGYIGGKIDLVMMRLVDVLYSIPRLIFVITLISMLDWQMRRLLMRWEWPELAAQARLVLLFVGLGAVEWLTMARIVRGQVLTLKERQFVTASRALGQNHFYLLFRHILPNLTGIILVYLTLTIPVVILEESLLSFLGLGVQAPLSSWGIMISSGAQIINPIKSYWWLLFTPSLAMAITLLALNFVGDGLRDWLDPRSQSH
ncbi:MAG: ABC transporter permease [Verrucomicrobiae bacterium]|nr:ABC transporter permease [Verrucomicrobiae bacterium]